MKANIIAFPAIRGRDWTDMDRLLFDYLRTQKGLGATEAAAQVNEVIDDREAAMVLPMEERLAFFAQRARARFTDD